MPLRSYKHMYIRECLPLGVNKVVNIPLGNNSPLGVKFTPRRELHSWGQAPVVKNWRLRSKTGIFYYFSEFRGSFNDERTRLEQGPML
jgi:hypothetical protein